MAPAVDSDCAAVVGLAEEGSALAVEACVVGGTAVVDGRAVVAPPAVVDG